MSYTEVPLAQDTIARKWTGLSRSIDEAEALAGFKILEPTFLPDGYVLRAIDYSAEDQHIGLLYYIPSNDQSPKYTFYSSIWLSLSIRA